MCGNRSFRAKYIPDIPRLFDPGGEPEQALLAYLVGQEQVARDELTAIARLPFQRYDFLLQGVERTCLEVLSHIHLNGGKPAEKGGCPSDGGEYAAHWCYALLTYCSDHGQPPPDLLMQLALIALGCRHGRYTPQGGHRAQRAMADDLDLAERYVKDIPVFLAAAEMDGRVEADGVKLSDYELAKRLGVSRDTLGGWRESEPYKRKVADARRISEYVTYIN